MTCHNLSITEDDQICSENIMRFFVANHRSFDTSLNPQLFTRNYYEWPKRKNKTNHKSFPKLLDYKRNLRNMA